MTVQSFWRVDAKDTLEVLLTNYLGHRLPDEHHPFAAFSFNTNQMKGNMRYVTQKPALPNTPHSKHLQKWHFCVYLCSEFWF